MRALQKGFTLVELAIVLIIIGLIVGGVVGGQALVKQAQLRSVIREYERYKTATTTFSMQFNSLPGDFSQANQYFSSCIVDPSESDNTCNGDDNKKIEILATGPFERKRIWQHLKLADILPGNYTGYIDDKGPSSGFSNGEWEALHIPLATHSGNFLILGIPFTTTLGGSQVRVTGNSILSAKYTAAFDRKYDDGIANQGIILGLPGKETSGFPNCVNNDPLTNTSVSYVINDTVVCYLAFSL